MATLRVTSGAAAGRSIELDRDLVIGREGADFAVRDDPQISRRHASVRPVDGGVVIEDLGSTNGTFVNGRRITAPVKLTSSGILKVGACEISIELPAAAAPPPPPAAPPRDDRTQAKRGADPLQRPTAARAIPPAPAEGERPPPVAVPPPAAEDGAPPERGRGGPGRLVGVLVGLVVIGLAIFAITALTGEEATEEEMDQRMTLLVVALQGPTTSLVGTSSGQPFGAGTLSLELTFAGQPRVGRETDATGNAVMRFDEGSLTAEMTGTLRLMEGRRSSFKGEGEITGGTGEYEGATGDVTIEGEAENAGTLAERGRHTLTGTVKYDK